MNLDRDNLDALLLREKHAHGWSGFQKRENQANYLIGVAQLTDSGGVFLPGLTLEIEVKAPVIVERCLIFLTLRQRQGTKRPRIYQLEVCPRDKRSHNGITTIYGPHEHLLEDEPTPVAEVGVNCDNWDGSMAWFVSRTNISDLKVERPW